VRGKSENTIREGGKKREKKIIKLIGNRVDFWSKGRGPGTTRWAPMAILDEKTQSNKEGGLERDRGAET